MYLDLEPTPHATAGSKPVHIGYFDSQETAARAYDQESLKLRGPNSNLNLPLSSYAVSCAETRSTTLLQLTRNLPMMIETQRVRH